MTISEKKFLCSKCNKTFPHQRALDQHLNSKHTTNSTTPNGIKNIGCPHCNKLFVSKSAQDHHIFSKHENKLLTCPNCSKKFKSQAGLT